eukprot:jgi/Ulvmu1/8406/UM042_0113.1
MFDPGRPPFSTYTKTHEIQRQYVADIVPKTPGTKGYEIYREDSRSPKYDDQRERRMNTFRTQRGSPQDHHRPPEMSPCQYDGGKIVDRGRGKGTALRATGLNNPITNEWTVMPDSLQQSLQQEKATGRPSTTERRWRANGDVAPTHQRARAHGCTFAAYDPIRHTPLQEAIDPAAEAFRNRETARVWGETGVRHQHPPQGSYDPLRHEFTAMPTNGTDTEKANLERRRGRKTILHGETWGQHDPIRGEWTLKPASAAFKDEETQKLKESGRIGSGRARVATPRGMGKYDPIRNVWVEPPQDRRMVEGLSYHPRGLFSTYGRTQ